MRKVKKSALLAAVAAATLSGSRLKADFAVSVVRTDLDAVNSITANGNGAITGNFAMVQFFAENLGTNGTGTKLSSVSLTMSDTGSGNLVIGGYSGTGTPSSSAVPDIFGQHEISSNGTTYSFKQTQTSTTGAPKYVSFVNILGDPTNSTDNNPNNIIAQSISTFSPAVTYSNYGYAIKSFSGDYAINNGSPVNGVNATTANGGLGALFAVAVVPVADTVNVQGQFGGDMGPVTSFNHTNAVLPGDANFDGSVNVIDLNTLIGHYGTTGQSWSTGDFNGDGSVNVIDLNTLIGHYGTTLPTAQPAIAAASVPEPASLGMLGIPALLLLARRNRKP